MTTKDMSGNKTKSLSFEIKALDEESGKFSGYASTFGNKDRGDEIVVQGAFKKSIEENNGMFTLLYGHNWDRPMGFFSATEDEKGLLMEGEFNLEVEDGKKSYALAKQAKRMGAPFTFSIGYIVRKDGWEWSETLGALLLKDLELLEVSYAPVPMNDQAKLTDVKKLEEQEEVTEEITEKKSVEIEDDITTNPRTFENHLREAGFSKSESKRIASLAINHREDEELTELKELASRVEKQMESK